MEPDDIIQPRTGAEALSGLSRQCTATAKGTGQRCTRHAAIGGLVCGFHGGNAPQVKEAIRKRLLAMAEPAVDVLFRAMTSHGPPCEACGRSDADRDPVVVRAAQIVLDRTGFGPSQHLTVSPAVSSSSPCVEWMTDEQLAAMDAIFEDATRRMVGGEAKTNNSLEPVTGRVTRIERVVLDDLPGTRSLTERGGWR